MGVHLHVVRVMRRPVSGAAGGEECFHNLFSSVSNLPVTEPSLLVPDGSVHFDTWKLEVVIAAVY